MTKPFTRSPKGFFTAENFDGDLEERTYNAKTANAKVAPLLEENHHLNRLLHAKGVACLTGDHDLVTGFACPICFTKLSEQNRIMKEALEIYAKAEFVDVKQRGYQPDGTEDLEINDDGTIAREALAKCKELE